MPTLDIVIILLILLSAAIGLVRGLVKEVLSLVSWVAAFLIAVYFSQDLAQYLPDTWGSGSVLVALAFIALFVATLIAAGIVRWMIGQLVESTGLSGTDRFLGFVFGSARGFLVAVVVLIGVREIAGDARWYRNAQLPDELLAFEDEVRDILGKARDTVRSVSSEVSLD